MKKLSKQREILFKILYGKIPGFKLGELRCLYYKFHTPRKNTQYHYEMKRNSRMSAWMEQLSSQGLIYIDRLGDSGNLYSLTDKGAKSCLLNQSL